MREAFRSDLPEKKRTPSEREARSIRPASYLAQGVELVQVRLEPDRAHESTRGDAPPSKHVLEPSAMLENHLDFPGGKGGALQELLGLFHRVLQGEVDSVGHLELSSAHCITARRPGSARAPRCPVRVEL